MNAINYHFHSQTAKCCVYLILNTPCGLHDYRRTSSKETVTNQQAEFVFKPFIGDQNIEFALIAFFYAIN